MIAFRTLAILGVALPITMCAHDLGAQPPAASTAVPPTFEWKNGRWFDGERFISRTVWSEHGNLTDRRPMAVDSVIDLAGGFVVPPFGEAHNHNAVPSDTGISARYLREGIFYVQNPSNLLRDRDAARGRFNVTGAIDVTFSNAGFTGPGGHPMGLARRNVARGVWQPGDAEGGFYNSLADTADLEARWPAHLATRPDFVKTFLLFSDEYDVRLADSTTRNWRGVSPAVLARIVRKAHAARLRVVTHVETAADFRHAVDAGVDEINHLPGFRPEGDTPGGYAKLDRYRLTAADANAAAQRGVIVVTTVSEAFELLNVAARSDEESAELARAVRGMLMENLRLLRDAGVTIALGSDRYRASSSAEFRTLRATGLFTEVALLRMWSMVTPHAIFPDRRVGSLAEGAEASFLVLEGDPLVDLANVERIRTRLKNGWLIR